MLINKNNLNKIPMVDNDTTNGKSDCVFVKLKISKWAIEILANKLQNYRRWFEVESSKWVVRLQFYE